MKSISLSGSLRKSVGKKDARESRKQGLIPCVMYGGDKECHFMLKETELLKAIFTPETYLIKLNIEGGNHIAIMQEIQYHPVSDRVLHVDFYEVSETKPFTVPIPLKYVGTSVGVLRGGKLQKKMRKLNVTGLVNDIPDLITIDISKVDTTTPFRIDNLDFPKLRFVDPDRTVIACIQAVRGMDDSAANTEEGATEAE